MQSSNPGINRMDKCITKNKKLNVNDGVYNQCKSFMSSKKEMVYRDVSRGEKAKLYVIYVERWTIFKVHRSEYENQNAASIKFRTMNFKVPKLQKVQALEIIKLIGPKLSWEPQFLEGSREVLRGLGVIMNTLRQVGKIPSKSEAMIGKVRDFYDKHGAVINNLIVSVVQILNKCVSMEKFDLPMILDTLLDLYKIYALGEYTIKLWEPEMLITTIAATASMLLPSKLYEIFRRMSMFSNAKLLDDVSGFFSLYKLISQYIIGLLEYLPFKIPDQLAGYIHQMCDLGRYELAYKMENLYKQWQRDKKIILDADFRYKTSALQDELKNKGELFEWTARSKGFKCIYDNFLVLTKVIASYEKSTRQEPSFFVFEGPPGCLKSVYMNSLIKCLNKSSYAHITKPTTDGKDFYDSYNNQEVLFSDDVGQQGVSQWRQYINFVSPVICPLDCACAELKDTKFLTSELILVTTNSFSRMHGLMKSDGISDIRALWRRAFVFDFEKVRRDGPKAIGEICFKYYDGKMWKNNFPSDLLDEFKFNDYVVPVSFNSTGENKLEVLAWMKLIVETTLEMKDKQHINNELTSEDVHSVNNLKSIFKAEGWFLSDTSFMKFLCSQLVIDFKDAILDAITNLSLVVSSSINSSYVLAMGSVLAVTLFAVGYSLLTKTTSDFEQNGLDDNAKSILKQHNVDCLGGKNPGIALIQSQLYEMKLYFPKLHKSVYSVGLFSGRSFISVAHTNLAEEAYLTVYKNQDLNHRIIDNMLVHRYSIVDGLDISIWDLPKNYPSPFKSLSKFFMDKGEIRKTYLVTPYGVVDTLKIPAKSVDIPTPYTSVYSVLPNDFFYGLHGKGLCGSLIVTDLGQVLGVHISGNVGTGVGAALRLPDTAINNIKNILDGATGLTIETEISTKVIENFSGIKMCDNLHISCPKKSNYAPSPIFGAFPISRVPANLSVNGPHTVKDVAKKSFKPVTEINQDELDYAGQVLDLLIEPWDDIPMEEVIGGNSLLAGINKKSSNGFGVPKYKADCIDFESKKLKPDFEAEYIEFLSRVEDGALRVEDVVWTESLKDELRGVDKKLPRSFRVSRLHLQLLSKQVFGSFVENIVKNRDFNQIMIGINPFKEWPKLFNAINNKKKWAADIGIFDGGMLPQVQNKICEVLKGKYKGKTSIIDFIFATIIFCIVAINDDTFMTTHSMPSGHFLTAILNSCVNRVYKAMWYYREKMKVGIKPKPSDFLREIGDFVYGDDMINTVSNSAIPSLNALTMRDFFESIGMTFTTADKKPVKEEYQNIEDISFLKRNFVYHNKLQRVVCPLDLSTIYSTLSWLDSSSEGDVMQDKIHNAQREMFLHEDLYEEFIEKLESVCTEKGVDFVRLPVSYLTNLYVSGDYEPDRSKYGINTQ